MAGVDKGTPRHAILQPSEAKDDSAEDGRDVLLTVWMCRQ